MARRKVNKAEEIRQTFATLGHDARPKDVIAALADRKINVASAQVSNIKAALNGSVGKAGKGNGKHGDLVSLAALQAAKKLVESVGSLEAAQQVLGTLAKLQ